MSLGLENARGMASEFGLMVTAAELREPNE